MALQIGYSISSCNSGYDNKQTLVKYRGYLKQTKIFITTALLSEIKHATCSKQFCFDNTYRRKINNQERVELGHRRFRTTEGIKP